MELPTVSNCRKGHWGKNKNRVVLGLESTQPHSEGFEALGQQHAGPAGSSEGSPPAAISASALRQLCRCS